MRKLYLGEQKRVTLIFCCAATPFSTNQRAQLAGHCSLWSLCLLWLFPSFLGSHVNDSLAEPFSKGGEWIIRAGGLMSLRRQDFFFARGLTIGTTLKAWLIRNIMSVSKSYLQEQPLLPYHILSNNLNNFRSLILNLTVWNLYNVNHITVICSTKMDF